MKSLTIAATILSIFAATLCKAQSPGLAAHKISSSAVMEQPEGWDTHYQDGSCIVSTNDPPWRIKLGHLHGMQLILIFSAQNDAWKEVELPEGTSAWLAVDGNVFEAIGISNINGELILTTENSLKLQRSLYSAKDISINVKAPHMDTPIQLINFTLDNIPSAIRWLNTCNVIGVGALPR